MAMFYQCYGSSHQRKMSKNSDVDWEFGDCVSWNRPRDYRELKLRLRAPFPGEVKIKRKKFDFHLAIDKSSIKNLSSSHWPDRSEIGLMLVNNWCEKRKTRENTHKAARRSLPTKPLGNSELPIRLMLFLKILVILKRNSMLNPLKARCNQIALKSILYCTTLAFVADLNTFLGYCVAY